MKVLQVHNEYRQRGGEDTVVSEERRLLRERGLTVVPFIRTNRDLDNPFRKVGAALHRRRSREVARQLRRVISQEQPDVCHVHNVFMRITPVVYEVCHALHIPVVQTIHNFRLFCINAYLYRDGQICEDCLVTGDRTHGIRHGCYKNSRFQSRLMTDTIDYHWKVGTWQEKVTRYIALTRFAAGKLVEGGLPAEKITVKPNFVYSVDMEIGYEPFFLYVGRLEEAKGLPDLLTVAGRMPEVRFELIGACDDPSVFGHLDNIVYRGELSREETLGRLSRCRALIFPSRWYEGMPMTILEAMSMKKPIICRALGAMSSMVRHEWDGLQYETIEGLATCVRRLAVEESFARDLGEHAYETYQQRYTPEHAFDRLIDTYNAAIDED